MIVKNAVLVPDTFIVRKPIRIRVDKLKMKQQYSKYISLFERQQTTGRIKDSPSTPKFDLVGTCTSSRISFDRHYHKVCELLVYLHYDNVAVTDCPFLLPPQYVTCKRFFHSKVQIEMKRHD